MPFPMTIEIEGIRQPRGIKSVLQERGLWRDDLLKKCVKEKGVKSPDHACGDQTNCCATSILSNQPDFLEQEPQIMQIIKDAGHLCIFLPKYHCELNIIEFFWGATKRYTRENCDYSFESLKTNVPKGKALVKLATIRRW
jgi:transposase